MAEPRARKIALACDSCRRRKRKCDGKVPVCSLCEKSSYECVYDATLDQRRPAQKNYVAALEARVTLLESILQNAGVGDALGRLDLDVEPVSQHGPSANPVSGPSLAASTRATEAQNEDGSEFVPPDDAANVVESITLAAPEQSTIEAQSADQLDLGMASYVPLISLAAEHELLSQFWDWQRMHLPYIAPVPFLAAYAVCSEAAHPGEPTPPQAPASNSPFPNPLSVPRAATVEPAADLAQFISPLLLDAVFAIAALFHGNLEMSERFYRRAETRVLSEAANPRLATVQAMLIMATWELGHARAPATWTILGITCALAIRLGMHLDATPLLRRGVLTQRLFEARNFVFWAIYNKDRFCAICMGMHPLIDRRMITTPRHSSLSADNGGTPAQRAGVAANPDLNIAWWDPRVLGLGDMMNQAGWEVTRDLIRLTDTLFEGIYSFDAPKRTPQQDLELVTRNNLTIQRFLDEMPAWLRSTGVMRKKENGLVYLHLFTHLASIVASRPFLSPRPLPEESMRIDATTDPSQPNHSSHIIRRYRTLAFRVARASSLQIIGLVRHIPLSSPCVTLPYVVYSACTILLLAPDDPAAMESVRTGIACLESLDESGYWVVTAKDAKERILALARRWGVKIGSGKKVLGHLGGGSGGSSGGPGNGSSDDNNPANEGSKTNEKNAHLPSSSNNAHIGGGSTTTTTSSADAARGTMNTGNQSTAASSETQDNIACTQSLESAPVDRLYLTASNQTYDGYFAEARLADQGGPPPSYDDITAHQEYTNAAKSQIRQSNPATGDSGPGAIAGGMAQPTLADVYAQPQAYSMGLAPGPLQQVAYAGQQYTQQPIQIHYHIYPEAHSHQQVHHYHHVVPQSTYYPPQHQHHRHVAYASSHGDPQHDFGVPHQHWHQILTAPGPAEEFPPDPLACSDVAQCFRGTVETTQDPAFVQNAIDPYSGLAAEWFANAQDNFALITPDMYGKGIPFTAGGGTATPGAGGSGYSGYMHGSQLN